MDPISLAYYAAICGVLGVASPWMGSLPVRLIVGALVGIGAAALLPQVQALIGLGAYAA
jgi:hypothetical protein